MIASLTQRVGKNVPIMIMIPNSVAAAANAVAALCMSISRLHAPVLPFLEQWPDQTAEETAAPETMLPRMHLEDIQRIYRQIRWVLEPGSG